VRRGEYRAEVSVLTVHLRRYPTPQGWGGGQLLAVELAEGEVRQLRYGGAVVQRILLEPPLLATYLGPQLRERRGVLVDELPEEVVQAVLAAEDVRFFRHSGLSLRGILRAAWTNLRGGTIRQGGSTLTQQLVKNLYLTHERSWVRKLREAVLAVMLEARYDKRQILQAYLNEIYWGRNGPVNLIGLGAAAHAYFSKEAASLELEEAALLAGIIQAPSAYSPTAHPEKAKQRRDWVLGRLGELGWVDEARVRAALARPVELVPSPSLVRRAPYFADAMAHEARRRFGIATLDDAGFSLFGTVDALDQRLAEEAVAKGLEAIPGRVPKGKAALQAALVSLDPATGEILAYVGGRDYRASQFDRAGRARRQAGSAFKPVVLSAAFLHRTALPATLLEDSPLTVTLAGRRWSPKNDDGNFRGWVTVRYAMEQSLNVPVARLALQVGLPRVVKMAEAMGVATPLQPVPALALGAFAITPLELSTVYATLAAGGVRPTPHGLRAVIDPQGAPLPPLGSVGGERVMPPAVAYLVNSVLQGVARFGTGAAVARHGVEDAIAGKTGTSNDGRDMWFAGYSPDRASLVWVGYDDNRPTRLSGSRAALPIWSRFTVGVRPPGGYPDFPLPEGVVRAAIDPASGELATDYCPQRVVEVFPRGQEPTSPCRYHGFYDPYGYPGLPPEVVASAEDEARRAEQEAAAEAAAAEAERGGDERPSRFRRWLRRVFGSEKQPGDRRTNPP
jgi:penicillin-binding protein 1B